MDFSILPSKRRIIARTKEKSDRPEKSDSTHTRDTTLHQIIDYSTLARTRSRMLKNEKEGKPRNKTVTPVTLQ